MNTFKHDKNQQVHTTVSRRGFLGSTAATVALQSTLTAGAEDGQLLLWAYTDQLSYAANDTIRLHVSAQMETFDAAIYRVGAEREKVWSRAGIPTREFRRRNIRSQRTLLPMVVAGRSRWI